MTSTFIMTAGPPANPAGTPIEAFDKLRHAGRRRFPRRRRHASMCNALRGRCSSPPSMSARADEVIA
jgi:hypothetical protein